MKKYKLLKDLPDAKAGDIYQRRDIRPSEFENTTRAANCLPANWVTSSRWFEEVKEESCTARAMRLFNEYRSWVTPCFTHEDMREAFEAGGKMRYTYPTFEDYLKSKQ